MVRVDTERCRTGGGVVGSTTGVTCDTTGVLGGTTGVVGSITGVIEKRRAISVDGTQPEEIGEMLITFGFHE